MISAGKWQWQKQQKDLMQSFQDITSVTRSKMWIVIESNLLFWLMCTVKPPTGFVVKSINSLYVLKFIKKVMTFRIKTLKNVIQAFMLFLVFHNYYRLKPTAYLTRIKQKKWFKNGSSDKRWEIKVEFLWIRLQMLPYGIIYLFHFNNWINVIRWISGMFL